MKLLTALLIGVCSVQLLHAQTTLSAKDTPPSISGTLVDINNKHPLIGAVVVLRQRSDSSVVQSTVSDTTGRFSFHGLPGRSTLVLQIHALGYQPFNQLLHATNQASPTASKWDLGLIAVHPQIQTLAPITIKAQHPLFEMEGDKKIFHMDQDLASRGATALDVMNQVPSVLVNSDGSVSIRNSIPKIYVNGRPTSLSLDEIPADAISSIEVMTQPSAAYDASGGGAGILNLVLKKNTAQGITGQLRAGMDSRAGGSLGGTIALGSDKWSLSAQLNGMQRIQSSQGSIDRTTLNKWSSIQLLQQSTGRGHGTAGFGNAELDYRASPKSILYLSVGGGQGLIHQRNQTSIETDTLASVGIQPAWNQEQSSSLHHFQDLSLEEGWKQRWNKPGETLSSFLNIETGSDSKNTVLKGTDLGKNTSMGLDLQQLQVSSGHHLQVTYQSDYSLPLDSSSKIQAGIRVFWNQNGNSDSYDQMDSFGIYQPLPFGTSAYTSTQTVRAAYLNYSVTLPGTWNLETGLRAEQSDYSGTLDGTGASFTQHNPIRLFPSAFLTHSWTGQQQFQLGLSRRIDRPGFYQLIPFTNYTDKLNIRRGNPDLKPQFTYAAELDYSKGFSNGNHLLVSGYFHRATQRITPYLEHGLFPGTQDSVLISTLVNAASSEDYGVEVTSTVSFAPWWNTTLDVNLYHSMVEASPSEASSSSGIWSGYAKLNSSWNFGSGWNLQLTGMYQSKTSIPVADPSDAGGDQPTLALSAAQGYFKASYDVDLAVQKTLFPNKAGTLSLSINDLMASHRFSEYANSPSFTQTASQLSNPQMIRLNLSYRLGKSGADSLQPHRRSGGGQGQGG